MPGYHQLTISAAGDVGSGTHATYRDLPDEVIERTCSFLGRMDLLRVGMVNRHLQSIVQQNAHQLTIALDTAGYVLNPSCPPRSDATAVLPPTTTKLNADIDYSTPTETSSRSTPTITTPDPIPDHPPWPTPTTAADILLNLREKEKAWSRLKPRAVDGAVSVVGRTQIYELQCGIFVWAERYETSVSGERAFPHNLRLIPLPAALPISVASFAAEAYEQAEREAIEVSDGMMDIDSMESSGSVVTATSVGMDDEDDDDDDDDDDDEDEEDDDGVSLDTNEDLSIPPAPDTPLQIHVSQSTTTQPTSQASKPSGPKPRLSVHQSYASKLPLESRDVGFKIADLTLDPTQDLVVLSEYLDPQTNPPNAADEVTLNQYHLLTLSTLKPHPMAKIPLLPWPITAPTATSTGQLLQVLDDILAVLVIAWDTSGDPVHQAVRIWNWRNGSLLVDTILPYAPCAASFALLTPTEYLITTIASPDSNDDLTPAIQVYHFDHDPHQQPPLQPRFMASFDFPSFGPDVIIDGVDVRPDPAFPPRTTGMEPSGMYQPRQVVEDYTKGVFVFAVQALHQAEENGQVADDWSDLLLFVKKETILALAKKKDRESPGTSEHVTPLPLDMWGSSLSTMFGEDSLVLNQRRYRWDQWGPENSRLINNTSSNSHQWVCIVSGYRYVTSRRDRRPEHMIPGSETYIPERQGPHHLRVLDFNPFSIARHAEEAASWGRGSGYSTTLHTEPSVTPKKRVFMEDITTSLPYVEILSKGVHAFDGVMMDDSRILLIKASCGAIACGQIAS